MSNAVSKYFIDLPLMHNAALRCERSENAKRCESRLNALLYEISHA